MMFKGRGWSDDITERWYSKVGDLKDLIGAMCEYVNFEQQFKIWDLYDAKMLAEKTCTIEINHKYFVVAW